MAEDHAPRRLCGRSGGFACDPRRRKPRFVTAIRDLPGGPVAVGCLCLAHRRAAARPRGHAEANRILRSRRSSVREGNEAPPPCRTCSSPQRRCRTPQTPGDHRLERQESSRLRPPEAAHRARGKGYSGQRLAGRPAKGHPQERNARQAEYSGAAPSAARGFRSGVAAPVVPTARRGMSTADVGPLGTARPAHQGRPYQGARRRDNVRPPGGSRGRTRFVEPSRLDGEPPTWRHGYRRCTPTVRAGRGAGTTNIRRHRSSPGRRRCSATAVKAAHQEVGELYSRTGRPLTARPSTTCI